MAKVGSLVVSLQAETARFRTDMNSAMGHVRSMEKSISSMKRTLTAVGATVGLFKLVGVLKDSVNAANESDRAIAILNNALASQGDTSLKTSLGLQQYATNLQNVTGVSDEAILNGQSFLMTLGLQGDELKRATRLSLDFSARMGIDVDSAFRTVGKAAIGNVTALQKVGITVAETGSKSLKGAAAMKQLETRLGGASEAAGQTFGGQMNILSQKFNDFQESVGRAMMPTLGALIDTFTDLATSVTDSGDRVLGLASIMNRASETVLLLRANAAANEVRRVERVVSNRRAELEMAMAAKGPAGQKEFESALGRFKDAVKDVNAARGDVFAAEKILGRFRDAVSLQGWTANAGRGKVPPGTGDGTAGTLPFLPWDFGAHPHPVESSASQAGS